MGLSAQDIAAVVKEIAPALIGGWIQKVYQPAPRAITLEIRTPGRTVALFVSADPETARLHLLTERSPNPPAPPPLCQFLRAHIQGARIDMFQQVPGDRIVRLRMTAREGPCSFLAELTGRRADLLLLNAEDKIMIALESGRERAGQAYHLPSSRLPADHTPADTLASDTGAAFPISSAIAQRYHHREEELATLQQRQARSADLRKRIKKVARRIEALRSDLDKAARYQDYARYGELLKTNLHAITKGQDGLLVLDYFDPDLSELLIPLDPAKSPHGNMDDYFRKHRKHLAAEREIRPRLDKAERDLAGLRAESAALEKGSWEPGAARQLAGKRSGNVPVARQEPSNPKKSTRPRAGPFRRFVSVDGLAIYVGRNADENETLTFNEARPDDLWLHAHGTPGSHVVMRVEKGTDPSPESLRDAATLALLYSDFKKSGKENVIYTKRKYVRKVKGHSRGTVTVTQEKTIFITLDRLRLDRLKEAAC